VYLKNVSYCGRQCLSFGTPLEAPLCGRTILLNVNVSIFFYPKNGFKNNRIKGYDNQRWVKF
jgi:hypothetical protein